MVRPAMTRLGALTLGMDLGEMAGSPGDYASPGELFRRSARPGARPWLAGRRQLGVPCDGVLMEARLDHGFDGVRAKGTVFPLERFLGEAETAAEVQGGWRARIHLRPRDLHHVHAPARLHVERVRFIGGDAWPVNPRFAPPGDAALVENRRAVITGTAEGIGPLVLVLVGALGVRDIALADEARPGSTLESGQWLGEFRAGSLVVIFVGRGEGNAALRGGPTAAMLVQRGEILREMGD